MAYTFDAIFATDPNNSQNVAANAAITLFDPADAGKAPITITDVTGAALPNPITVNKNGFGPAFVADIDRVAWHGAGFTGYFTSYEGMKAVAVDAQAAAAVAQAATEVAAGNAQAAAEAAEAAAYASAFPDSQSITYNPDGSVAVVTENGIQTAYTYNTDGSVATDTRAGVTRTYTYTNGNLTGIEAA